MPAGSDRHLVRAGLVAHLLMLLLSIGDHRTTEAYPSNMLYALYQLPAAGSESWIDGDEGEPWPLRIYSVRPRARREIPSGSEFVVVSGGPALSGSAIPRRFRRSQPSVEQDPYFFSNIAAGQTQDFTLEPFVFRLA